MEPAKAGWMKETMKSHCNFVALVVMMAESHCLSLASHSLLRRKLPVGADTALDWCQSVGQLRSMNPNRGV